jgi:uncharacterized protein (DUF2336 family)
MQALQGQEVYSEDRQRRLRQRMLDRMGRQEKGREYNKEIFSENHCTEKGSDTKEEKASEGYTKKSANISGQ